MAKAAAPRIMVEVGPHARLSPVGPYDQAALGQQRRGRTFELVPVKQERSLNQLRLYWMVLAAVVEATGSWPTSAHLHEVLVRHAGFVVPVLDPFTGTYREERDSISFDRMPQDEMNLFFETALAKLSEAIGFDVTELLPPKEKGTAE